MNNENKVTTTQRLNELIALLGITQQEMSKRVGIDTATLSMYMTGKRIPKQNKLAVIAETFHLDPAWLMGYDVPMYRKALEKADTDTLVDFVINDEMGSILVELETLSPKKLEHLKSYLRFLSTSPEENE